MRQRQSNSLEDYNIFSLIRSQCKNLTGDCYSLFISNAENSINNSVKNFWNFVRSQSGQGTIPKAMFLGADKADNEADIADLFANHFSSVYNPRNAAINDHHSSKYEIITNMTISPTKIEKVLLDLDITKGAGPDGISNRVLRLCAHSLYLPLHLLFQQSLNTGTFPEVWKLSFVCPIHKSGGKNDIANYRPVSILSAIPKLFEHCIETVLSDVFGKIVVDQQHGFTSGRSVDTNLFCFTNFINDSFEKGNETHAIYTDFSKAFDKVNHSILLSKLNSYGISGKLLSWINSYLLDRRQQVKIDGHLSKQFVVTSGVPQGSHLGPLLFNLFINDLSSLLSSHSLMFADDMKIFCEVSSVQDMLVLQRDLITMFDWCERNDMSLNVNKCCFMRFSRLKEKNQFKYCINNVTLNEQNVVKDLGVYLDSKLVFLEHFEVIVARANRMLGFIKRVSKDFKNVGVVKLLYTSLVRSILEFSNIVWSPYYQVHINRLENIQHKFIKYAGYKLFCNGISLDNDQTMLYLNLTTLVRRREYYDVCFAFNILNSFIKSPDCLKLFSIHIPSYQTRNKCLLHVPYCRTSYLLYSPVNRISANVNKYCDRLDFFNVSQSKFKCLANRAILG